MKTCGNCLLQKQNGGICPIFQEKANPDDLSCRRYIGHDSPVCSFCGSLMSGKGEIILLDNDDNVTLISCHNCAETLGTCQTCALGKTCDFETNPINIPKQIPRVIRQGNMQMQTIIRNPEREKETCMKGCLCWDESECACMRQTLGACAAWRYK